MTKGLLLDTHIFLAVIGESERTLPERILSQLSGPRSSFVSVTTLWEIAIKARLGKLELKVGLGGLPKVCESFAFTIVDIKANHVLAEIEPEVTTRDPFDRLLLAQCAVEELRLVTLDRALSDHPLAISQ